MWVLGMKIIDLKKLLCSWLDIIITIQNLWGISNDILCILIAQAVQNWGRSKLKVPKNCCWHWLLVLCVKISLMRGTRQFFSGLQLRPPTVLQPLGQTDGQYIIWKSSKNLKVPSQKCINTFEVCYFHSKYPHVCSASLVSGPHSFSKTLSVWLVPFISGSLKRMLVEKVFSTFRNL